MIKEKAADAMMDKNIEVLEEVLDVLEEEKKKIYDLVDENDFKIERINSYLRELSKREQDDFKVFSPRSVENVQRERIASDTSEKEKYEAENVEFQKKIDFLKNLIDKVNVVIDNLRIEEEKAEQRETGEKNEKPKNMGECSGTDHTEQIHIAHQILNCVSYISLDAERAKIELTAIAKKMELKETTTIDNAPYTVILAERKLS